MRLPIIAVCIAVATFMSSKTVVACDWHYDNIARVVAIADIHGDYSAMVNTLQKSGILDAQLAWVGDESHLVVVGDILDRGPDSRAAMDLLMSLEGEALEAGGQVHILIGNHESMILTGDMRYVSAAEYAAFAGEEDAGERARWFELYAERHSGDASSLRSKFDEYYPQGYFAMRRAFRADGKYGEWLLKKNIIDVINGTAFVHGGLSPEVARTGLHGVNRGLQQGLVEYVKALATLTDAEVLLPTDSHYDYDAILGAFMPAMDENKDVLDAVSVAKVLGDSALLNSDGPLWYRRNATCQGIVEEHRLDAALTAIGADRLVVGHTPTPTLEVVQRFNGRLIEIDTGMLGFYYGGSGNALVLEGEKITVINQSGATATEPVQHPRRIGHRSRDLTPALLGDLLAQGAVTRVQVDKAAAKSATQPSLVSISDGEHTVSALFNEQKSRGFYPGVAAYRLDRMLRLDMVPVTVIREIDGKNGSLQFLPDRRIDEVERSASRLGGGASCPISDQWDAMYVFDILIFNEGRTLQRMLYDTSTWRLMLSEQNRAFASKKGRPGHLRSVELPLTEGWEQVLGGLTDDVLEVQFGDVLDKRRRRALAGRRDELLAQH